MITCIDASQFAQLISNANGGRRRSDQKNAMQKSRLHHRRIYLFRISNVIIRLLDTSSIFYQRARGF